MATPIDEASRRCASRVEFSATTAKTTSPGCRYFTPSLRASILQLGGKMEETRTRFWAAMPASRSANSKEVSRSRCFPTPLVKKILFGTMSLPNSVILRQANIHIKKAQSNTTLCKGNVNLKASPQKIAGRRLGAPAATGDQIWEGESRLLRFYRTHRDGVVFVGSHHCDLGAGLLVERGQSGLVAGFERVHFVAHDQGILGPLGHAGPSASGIIARHGVLGAAHRVADRPRESLAACGKRRGGQACG